MTSNPDSRKVLGLLQQLRSVPTTDSENFNTAEKWKEAIEKTSGFLDDTRYSIVFIGPVGVGKSSLIAVTAGLLLGPAPTDKTSLKNNSILAIGAGRMTVCEVRIRPTQLEDPEQLGLLIEPFSQEEMELEIRQFAEDEWRRRKREEKQGNMEDADPTAHEIRRAIRAMTGYSEKQESYKDEGGKKRRTIDPLDDVTTLYDSLETFTQHLIERANLPTRSSPPWWGGDTPDNRKMLKERFEAVNQGREPNTMLPRSITVVMPKLLYSAVGAGMELNLVDTRGLNPGGSVESRADLQKFLRDPRSVIVLCATFRDAPGEGMLALLRSMSEDVELREVIPNILLALLDLGDADQVPDADGNREFGQDIRINQCHLDLERAGVSRMNKSQIIAFDVLQDDRQRVLDGLDERLSTLRGQANRRLNEQMENAQKFLDNISDERRPQLLHAIDEQIKQAMAHHLPKDAPLRDPLEGLYQAIDRERWAAVVYAACRRNGEYNRGLDLYASIENTSRRAATKWLDGLINAILAKLVELKENDEFLSVMDHICLRERMYKDAQIEVVSRYAKNVRDQVRNTLKSDQMVWHMCCNEWGQGLGFKYKVLTHLKNWSKRQQSIMAHESTDAENLILHWREVAKPLQAARFTLHVRNVRAVRTAVWTPEPVSVLIGANGAGKTTLIKTLKLLKNAYEQDLAKAVTNVLGGSFNLKSWGISEEDVVEIGIDLDNVSWRIQLIPREGTVDYLTSEYLLENGREVFSRDSLGVFTYGDERIEPGKHIGLRILMDRGTHEYAVRTIAQFLQGIAAYDDIDLWSIREYGSNASDNSVLNARGTNALALLRRWRDERPNNHRYEFVVEGLQAAFPNTFESIDFVAADQTLTARIYPPGQESPSPLRHEANGFLQLLILFCAVAGAEDESVVAIDEPENGLHPYALRTFLRRTNRWAKQHYLTVLLATHSVVLLDELTGHPEQVFVMKTSEEQMPTRLDKLCNIEWLESFNKLGDLYEEGEIGSNEDGI